MKLTTIPAAAGSRVRHPIAFAGADDSAEFFAYPAEEQDAVRELADAMVRIGAASNPHQGAKAEAWPGVGGWSAARLRTLYDEWVESGRDWRTLVDKRRYPDAREPALPEEFRAHIRSMFSSNQRKNAPAYRAILRQWERWWTTGDPQFALPGYAECPPPGKGGRYPDGWSERHLNRFAPPEAELVLGRVGVHAAMRLLPHIPGTREGVRFLEWVSGDDVWLDRKIIVPGHGPCRVVQFGMMDYGASYYLDGFIQRPVLPREDGTTEQLKRRDFLWCVAMMLERYGYPLDYVMHIICERGTATMSRAEARFLYEVSNGQIVVGYSGMDGEMVHAWDERKTGNSRAKSWHESFHNLFHNEQADLPGQVGKDRDHTPAALHGREIHAQALHDMAMLLSPEERARLKMPFPDAHTCYLQTMERVAWINQRKQHDCEGFEMVMEWRPKGLSILPLPERALEQWLKKNPRANLDTDVEWFPRPEMPAERMHRISAGHRFMRLPGSVWERFYSDLHEIGRVGKDGSFSFKRDGRTYRFVPPSPEEALPAGTEVSGFYRPDGSGIHLFSGGKNTRYLITWPAEKRVRRDDDEAKQAAFARTRGALNVAMGNVRRDFKTQIEEATADAQENLRVLAENGLATGADAAVPRGEHLLAAVQDGCTPAAAAVQAVTEDMQRVANEREDMRRVDIVKETLRRPRKEKPDAESAWL